MMQKEELLSLLGPFPQKTPLHPAFIESIDCGKYIRKKGEYNVELNERISAYILLPKHLKEQTPAIFCYHQHASRFDLGSEVAGLVGDLDQALAVELAELGYITFAPDAIGFEDSNWDPNKSDVCYFELSTRLIKGQIGFQHDFSGKWKFVASHPIAYDNRSKLWFVSVPINYRITKTCYYRLVVPICVTVDACRQCTFPMLFQ